MKKRLPLLLFALLAHAGHAVETLEILMIGNSYTTLGGTWSNLEGFLDADPDFEANMTIRAPNSHKLQDHWNDGTGPTVARGLIMAGGWDYVFFQEQSQVASYESKIGSTYNFSTSLDIGIGFGYEYQNEAPFFDTRTAVDNVTVVALVPGPPDLAIVGSDQTTITLQWSSKPGCVYDLLGDGSLQPDPASWPLYDGNAGIPDDADDGTPIDDGDSGKTTVQVNRPAGRTFFFAVSEN